MMPSIKAKDVDPKKLAKIEINGQIYMLDLVKVEIENEYEKGQDPNSPYISKPYLTGKQTFVLVGFHVEP